MCSIIAILVVVVEGVITNGKRKEEFFTKRAALPYVYSRQGGSREAKEKDVMSDSKPWMTLRCAVNEYTPAWNE